MRCLNDKAMREKEWVLALVSIFLSPGQVNGGFIQSPFNPFLRNYAITYNPMIKYTRGTGNDSVLSCSVSCLLVSSCYMFCYQNGLCVLGHLSSSLTAAIVTDPTLSSTGSAYTCYNKMKYFEFEDFADGDIVGTSVALRKPTVTSSNLYGYNGSFAVDGGHSPDFWGGLSCMHTSQDSTKQGPNPYLQIDLQVPHLIMAFNITNRNENPERLHDLELRVGNYPYSASNSNFQKNALCYSSALLKALTGPVYYVTCSPEPLIGRYVSLQIVRICPNSSQLPTCKSQTVTNPSFPTNILCVCELDVFGIQL